MPNKYLSSIIGKDGQTYHYKDAEARESLATKAPGIYDTETGFRHDNANTFTMLGNPYAFGTARYANKKNLIVLRTNSRTKYGVTQEVHDAVITFNGTCTTADDWNALTDDTVDISAGTYTFGIDPYLGNSILNQNAKSMFLDAWYDGNTSSTYDVRTTLAVKDASVSATATFASHVYKIRVWAGISGNSVYDGYRIFPYLFPSTVTITNTGEAISSTGSLVVTPTSTLTELDTMMHKSSISTLMDTKTYVDNHTQEIDYVYYRPEDYGAVGNGVADDTTAIQACINAAQQNSDKVHAIRAYGIYKITQSITFNARELDVFFNRIDYTGNDAAVIISASLSHFSFQSVRATAGGSSAVCIRCYQGSGSGFTNTFFSNRLECAYLMSNGNTVEFKQDNSITLGNGSIMYNVCRFNFLKSSNANLIYLDCYNFGENDFYGKVLSCTNGYAIYANKYCVARFYGFCFETDVKNAIYNCGAFLGDYRCTEMLNLQTSSDHTKGWLYTFNNQYPFGHAGSTFLAGTSVTCVNLDNALSYSDCIARVKAYFEENPSVGGELGWRTAFPPSSPSIPYSNYLVVENVALTANANMNSGLGQGIHKGTLYAYYNHLAFKPNDEVYYKVTGNLTIEIPNDYAYVTPTTFDIDTSSATISLDYSYCAIAINHFDVIQHSGKTAIVYDKEGNCIFNGTSLGAGVYHFKCEFVSLDSLSVTLDGGTVKSCPSTHIRGLYTGSNEKWTVSKEELIEPPLTGYTFYDYVQSDGTAFIDTGLNAQTYGVDTYEKEIKFVLTEFTMPSGYPYVVGATNSWGNTGFYICGETASTNKTLYICTNGQYSNTTITLSSRDDLITVKTVGYETYVDGTLIYTASSSTTTINNAMNIPLFTTANYSSGAISYDGYYVSTPCPAKIYEYTIKDPQDNVVAHMVPAKRNSDNAAGMWDTVRQQFFTNANSSGTLTVGDDT